MGQDLTMTRRAASPPRLEAGLGVARVARSFLRDRVFISFEVTAYGHLIAAIDAPYDGGKVGWSHAAICGFADFDDTDRARLGEALRTYLR